MPEQNSKSVGSTYDARARYRQEQAKLPGAYVGLRIAILAGLGVNGLLLALILLIIF